MLEALASRLVSASVATLATNLFLGHMPEEPDTCLALFQYSGSTPRETLNTMSTTVEVPGLQVMARAAAYPSAYTLILQARDTLTNITNETIDGVRFLRVSANGAPDALGRDATERSMFSLALTVFMER